MVLKIPKGLIESTRMTEAEILLELAVTLFQREKLSMGQASTLAGMTQFQFQHLLASRDISPHYDIPELEEDLQTLRTLGRI